jgi:hypothetical protein
MVLAEDKSKQGAQTIDQTELTPDKAMEVVARITGGGPEGLVQVFNDLSKRSTDIRTTITQLGGELVAITRFQDMLKRLAVAWGIAGLSTADARVISPSGKVITPPAPDTMDPEVIDRIQKHLCIFKSRETKQFCARVLKTKCELEHNYCTIHIRELG